LRRAALALLLALSAGGRPVRDGPQGEQVLYAIGQLAELLKCVDAQLVEMLSSEIADRVAEAPQGLGVAAHERPAAQQKSERRDASAFAPKIEQAGAHRVDVLDGIFSLGQIGNHGGARTQDD
jgi:hypothetical protein